MFSGAHRTFYFRCLFHLNLPNLSFKRGQLTKNIDQFQFNYWVFWNMIVLNLCIVLHHFHLEVISETEYSIVILNLLF